MFGEYNQAFVAINVIAILAVLVLTRVRPWIPFVISSCVLHLAGVTSLETMLQGYTNPSLLALLLLYLVSIPLERTQLLRGITAKIIRKSEIQSTFLLGLFSGLFSGIVNNTAVVASLLGPIKRQTTLNASKLLLPLSYASILGGTLTLIGTSTNLIINGFVIDHELEALRFFDFTLIGAPVFSICLILLVIISPKVLKGAEVRKEEVVQEYFLERRIGAESSLNGRTVEDNGLRNLSRMFLIEVIRGKKVIGPVSPQEVLQQGDVLVFTGDLAAIDVLDEFDGLETLENFDPVVRDNLKEVIISPTSTLVGRNIKQADFRSRFNAAVVAVRRGGLRLGGGLGELELHAGDALVLAAGSDFGKRQNVSADFIMVGGVETNRVLEPLKEYGLTASFAIIVILGATGFVPLVKGLIVLTAVMLFTKIVSVEDIRSRFPLELMLVIGSALSLAQAMFQTGLADTISLLAGEYLAGVSLFASLAGVFFLSWLLTEMVTNNAAAAIMFPIAIAISSQWGADYMPFVMAVAFGASASFLSPVGYQTNLMVFTAGNYRVADYLKLGVPILVVYSISTLGMISLIYDI